jgi:hypothetical protein
LLLIGDKFTECNGSSVRNGGRGLQANAAGAASGIEPFAWASLLAMLTDIAPFFHEMVAGWRVPFLRAGLGTLGIRSSMSAPSPSISWIRPSVIQVGLESMLSAGFHFGWNWVLECSAQKIRSRDCLPGRRCAPAHGHTPLPGGRYSISDRREV